MIRRILLTALLSVFAWNAAWAEPRVTHVRLGQHKDVTRIVLESTQELKQEHFTLPSPARFVLDFRSLSFDMSMSSISLPQGGLVQGIRQGNFKPGVVRMVLDLDRAAVASVFSIPKNGKYSHRLVIDLKPATAAEIQQQKEANITHTSLSKEASRQNTPVMQAAPKRGEMVIVLDPGHGGVDPGAIGKRKTYEKHVTLDVAKRLRDELQKRPGVKVYLTRYKDVFVPLKERVRIAQSKHADLFVSLHADAHRNRRIKGGSVYVLSDRSSDKEAERLARQANEGDIIAGLDLSHESKEVQNILIDLTQRETMNKSAMLAKEVLSHMDDVVTLRKEKIMFAGFRVLKAPEIPSVLVEMSYLSNPTEEKNLKSANHQTRIAKAIASGIDSYVKKHMHN